MTATASSIALVRSSEFVTELTPEALHNSSQRSNQMIRELGSEIKWIAT